MITVTIASPPDCLKSTRRQLRQPAASTPPPITPADDLAPAEERPQIWPERIVGLLTCEELRPPPAAPMVPAELRRRRLAGQD